MGNVPPSSIAELDTMKSLVGVVEGAVEIVVVVVVAEPEQADIMPRARDVPMMKIRLRSMDGRFTPMTICTESKEKL